MPSLLPVLPGWGSVEEDIPSPAGPICSRVGWYPRWYSPLSKKKEMVQCGKGFVSVGLGGDKGGVCDRDRDLK